jgi:hypothetical protein
MEWLQMEKPERHLKMSVETFFTGKSGKLE